MQGLVIIWKVYITLWIIFRSFTLGTRMLFDSSLQNAKFLALGMVSFIPLIGFILEKPVFEYRLWRAWLILLLAWLIIDRTFYTAWFLQQPFDEQWVGVLLALPCFAATYRYSRANFGIWQTQKH